MRAALPLFLLLRVASQPSSHPLFAAVRAGDVKAYAALLDSPRGATLDVPDASGSTPLITLLVAWHAALEAKWPEDAPSRAGFAPLLHLLLDAGASPGALCPTLDAAATSNGAALAALVRRLNGTAAVQCLAGADATGAVVAHHAVASSAPGLSRLMYRARRRGVVAAASETAAATELGLEPRRLPQWSAFGELRKRTLDDAAGSGDGAFDALSDAFTTTLSRPGHDNPLSDALEARDDGGWSPLEVACREGRPVAVAWLAALLTNLRSGGGGGDNTEPDTDADASASAVATPPPPPPTLHTRGITCAHLAASRDYARVLTAAARGGVPLDTPDAFGRTPCDCARACGRLCARALAVLFAEGACGESGNRSSSGVGRSKGGVVAKEDGVTVARGAAAIAVDGSVGGVAAHLDADRELARCPSPTQGVIAGATVRGTHTLPPRFQASEHTAAGWSTLDSSALQLLGLSPHLLSAGGSMPAGNAATASTRTIDDDDTWVPRVSPLACGIDELPPHALAPAAREGLLREYLDLGRPFLVRDVVDAGPSFLHPDAHGSGDGNVTYTTSEALFRAWGQLRVSSGPIPYAATYGHDGGERVQLGAFMAAHMGTRKGRGARGHVVVGGVGGEERVLPSPPYVFDGHVLRAPHSRAVPPRALFDAARALLPTNRTLSLLQLIIGPPLSGAQPHYHREAVNALFIGLKLWFLTPPAHASFVDATAAEWWSRVPASRPSLPPHIMFLQGPGELVFVPSHWGHAVINLCDSVAMALE